MTVVELAFGAMFVVWRLGAMVAFLGGLVVGWLDATTGLSWREAGWFDARWKLVLFPYAIGHALALTFARGVRR